jgi:hypothetical protein
MPNPPSSRTVARLANWKQQPTEFWLDVFPISTVWEEPSLISSLANYSELRQNTPVLSPFNVGTGEARDSSILFLRIDAAADYYTHDKNLMQQPPPVLVDVILDPFLLNVFPRSLLPTAVYVSVVALIAWVASNKIWNLMLGIASQATPKPHAD